MEVLSPGFFRSMPGRTFKSKRGCSRRKQQLRRRSPFLSSFPRCRRSRSRCQSLYRSCLRTIEELIKIIASHSITYPPFVLHLFSFSNVFQHCILPPPIFLAVRTSTYRINETTLSSNLSSIKHPKKKKNLFHRLASLFLSASSFGNKVMDQTIIISGARGYPSYEPSLCEYLETARRVTHQYLSFLTRSQ